MKYNPASEYDDDPTQSALSDRFIYREVDELNLRPHAVARAVEIVGFHWRMAVRCF